MSLRPRQRPNIHITEPEPNPAEHWWEGGSSTGMYRFCLCSCVRTSRNVFSIYENSPKLAFLDSVGSLDAIIDENLSYRSNGNRNLVSKPTPSRKRTLPTPLFLGAIEEEGDGSQYYLNLGAESPTPSSPLIENAAFVEQWAAAGIAVPRVPVRRPSWRSSSSVKDRERARASKKDAVDRDCGICFEYSVTPCRTLCCGKIFCTAHLEDWLHGPNAEGRCPNCENACSLEGGTLSLAIPSLSPSSRAPNRNAIYPASPLSALQTRPNDTLQNHPSLTGSPPSSKHRKSSSASKTSSTATSTTVTVDTLASDDDMTLLQLGVTPGSLSTTPFSTSWGAVSRLMSLVTFMMFLYKLLS